MSRLNARLDRAESAVQPHAPAVDRAAALARVRARLEAIAAGEWTPDPSNPPRPPAPGSAAERVLARLDRIRTASQHPNL